MTGPAADDIQKTILLVDDEPAVRSIVMKILRRANYVVLEADSGAAALNLAKSHAEIDLVITDLYMPGQQGPEVVKDLAIVRPGLKVLFISGYANPDIVARTGVSGGANFLQKPFSALELTTAVKAAIG